MKEMYIFYYEKKENFENFSVMLYKRFLAV
jgi:hypothetical protein